MKFHVSIVLHDVCIYRISLTFARKSRTVSLLYEYGVAGYGYGLDVVLSSLR